MRRAPLVFLCAFVLVPAAGSRSERTVLLGVLGNKARFASLTGQYSAIGHVIVGWSQGYSWGAPMLTQLQQHAPIPMIGLDTARGWPNRREAITPRGIAFGRGDDYLFAINRAIAAWGRPVYLRPFGEMNGHWNYYCAFTRGGRSKGASHSTRMFRRAFARVYLLAHGGTATQINGRLARLGLPPIRRDLELNAAPTLKVVWNPQGYGSPNIPANSAAAYYPGDRFVDVVANDLYDMGFKAQWAANERLYRRFRSKPFAIAEWGLWGIDDSAFVRRMAGFAETHGRVEFISYFESRRGSIFDLGTKPRSRAAYRRYIRPLGR